MRNKKGNNMFETKVCTPDCLIRKVSAGVAFAIPTLPLNGRMHDGIENEEIGKTPKNGTISHIFSGKIKGKQS